MRNLLLFCGLVLAAVSCAPSPSGPTTSWKRDYWGHRAGPKGFATVILDAGHGGKDSGAVSGSTGAMEKNLALDTVKRVQAKLRGRANVILMRSDDTFVDLDERVNRASRRDGTILVSIHYNSGPSRMRGPELYWWRVDSWGLATRLQRNLEAAVPGESGNRGQVRRRLRLTRNPNVPSVLVECGYLSNPAEARMCNNAGYRDKLASAIADAILDQQREGDPAGSLPRPINAPPSRPTDPPGS
ncbi:N-acetylmuramoyl-L-alanine amidase [Haloferula sargassicola]|uniref:N-acetylmuramoyl-L-alanine amidase n=1 Tax=Haloferula sargassicola TaxID=490096 RepID=A0ABP9UPJ9_9BACT